MSLLEKAVEIAVSAHAGQVDKAGKPYILHPLRLMMRMETEPDMIAAVLHDVIEDSDWTIQRLRDQGFADEIVETLVCLTRIKDETYDEFIERILKNPAAMRVKQVDLEDNMDIRRLGQIESKDTARIKKYHKAWKLLKQ